MFKMLIPLLALAISNVVFAAEAPMFQKKYDARGDSNDIKRVVDTMKSAIEGKKPNRLKDIVTKMKKELDGAAIGEVTKYNIFKTYSGRGGAGSYSTTYLVGIPVAFEGTGRIESYELYFEVRYNLEMGEDSETVTVEKQVKLTAVN